MRDNLYIIGRGAIGKALENQIFTNGSETSIEDLQDYFWCQQYFG